MAEFQRYDFPLEESVGVSIDRRIPTFRTLAYACLEWRIGRQINDRGALDSNLGLVSLRLGWRATVDGILSRSGDKLRFIAPPTHATCVF